ncbi:MAG: hypothetical protein ACO1NZ_15825 [Adhaeribacter sp.]
MSGSILSIFLSSLFVPLAFLFASNSPELQTKTIRPLLSSHTRQELIKKAEFPGGRKAIGQYLDNNLTIPEVAFKMKGRKKILMGGTMEVEIKADGTAQFLRFSKSWILPDHPAVVEAVTKEFTRVIASMPKWTPALKDGQPFPSKDTLQYIAGGYEGTTYEEYKHQQEQKKANKPANTFSFSDLKTKDGSQVYSFVQQQPKFPGGDKALKAYLMDNLPYLQRAKIDHKGRPIVFGLIINKQGIAEDIILIHPMEDPAFNHLQAQEVLNRMPVWEPGKQNKTAIAVAYTIPFRF